MSRKRIENSIEGEHKTFEALPTLDNKNILTEAKNDGSSNTEVSDENLPTVLVELGVTLRAYKTRLYLQAQSYFKESDDAIRVHEKHHNIDNLRTSLSTATIDSEDLDLHRESATLTGEFQTFESQRDNYNKFKKMNSLNQLPKNSDPLETKFQIYALVALILVEIIINFLMLKGGGRTDASAALGISVAQVTFNVLSCFLLGKVLLGHILHAESLLKRISTSILFLAHIYSIFLVNINMGIYRQSIINNASTFKGKTGQLLANFDWTPFPPEVVSSIADKTGKLLPPASLDPMSVIAIGVGLVFAFLAYWDGFKSDDSFPGYGHVYRGALKIKREIGARISKINTSWNNYLKNSNTEQKRIVESGLASINSWSHEINTIEQVWVDYRKLLFTLEDIYKDATKLYLSNYNKFHEKSTLRLKAKLLDDIEFDLRLQFKDVADLYMDDSSRLKEEKAKSSTFSKEISILQKELSQRSEKDTEFIKKLSKDYACPLN